MADLATRAELKRTLKDNTTANDTLYDDVLREASAAVRDFTQREFITPATTVDSTRRYIYDGSGVLEIDDAKTITAVKLIRSGVSDVVLTADEFEPQPYRSQGTTPYSWLDILPRTSESPEMGFERNLDTLWHKYLFSREVFVDVTGKWGWDAIPDAVVRATIWTAISFQENPRNVISEGVAGVHRSYANPSRAIGIPERAKELLYPWQRFK